MFRNLRYNDSGIVLVIVIILTIAMMIVTIGVISTNVSQKIYTSHQIDRIKAEQIAKGAAWHLFMDKALTNSASLPYNEIILDGKTYNLSFTEGLNSGPEGTDTYNITIQY